MAKPLRSNESNPPDMRFSHFGVLNDGAQTKSSLFVSVFLNILLALCAIVVGAAAKKGVTSPTLFPNLVKNVGLHVAQAIVAAVALALGWAAHQTKMRWQYRYGFAEVCFSVVSAWNLASGLSTHEALLSRWVALIASAYITARGLGNMAEAKRKSLAKMIETDRAMAASFD